MFVNTFCQIFLCFVNLFPIGEKQKRDRIAISFDSIFNSETPHANSLGSSSNEFR